MSPSENSPRIVYIGAERVGLACLKILRELDKNVVQVITAEEAMRGRIADWVSFDGFAVDQSIPLHKVSSARDNETIQLVQSLKPDLICVVSWSMIIPPEMLAIPPRGCVGFHYAMLPRRRGGAPLNWAIIDGLTESGITLFYLEEGLDCGDIIGQQPFDISEEDTVKDLLDKVVVIAPALLAQHIGRIEAGTAARIPQDESVATYTRRRRPKDGEIDWSKSDREIYNFIRALAPPYPSAFTTMGDRRFVIPAASWKDEKLHVEGYLE